MTFPTRPGYDDGDDDDDDDDKAYDDDNYYHSTTHPSKPCRIPGVLCIAFTP